MKPSECDERIEELTRHARAIIKPLANMSYQEVVAVEQELLGIKKQITHYKTAKTKWIKENGEEAIDSPA